MLISGCSGSESSQSTRVNGAPESAAGETAVSEDKVLNIYNWADYIDPSVIAAFEHEYGIKIHYDVFNSSEVLETKLLTGHSNYIRSLAFSPDGGVLASGSTDNTIRLWDVTDGEKVFSGALEFTSPPA